MSKQLDYYRLILYALLHDVGKPVIRFLWRYKEDIEKDTSAKKAKDILELFLGENIENIFGKRHEDISEAIVNHLLGTALGDNEKKSVNDTIAEVDRFAASERGIQLKEELYQNVKELWKEIEERLDKELGIPYRYSHYIVPMLSPLWVLVKTDYLGYVGISAYLHCKAGKWSVDEAKRKFAEFLKVICS
ncbi:MAG: HD domain-containing protein [Ignisphaera sp.]